MQTAGNAADVKRPLESLPLAIQRVNAVTVNVQQFLDRFNGPTPEALEERDRPPEPTHHAFNLDKLFAAIERLETRVEALGNIG